jgi:hypothetical protein
MTEWGPNRNHPLQLPFRLGMIALSWPKMGAIWPNLSKEDRKETDTHISPVICPPPAKIRMWVYVVFLMFRVVSFGF